MFAVTNYFGRYQPSRIITDDQSRLSSCFVHSQTFPDKLILKNSAMSLLLIFLLEIALHFTTAQKPGSYCDSNGDMVKRLGQLYVCEHHKLKLIGCVTDFGKQVLLGDTYYSQDFEWVCNRVTDHWNQIMPLVCWYKGKSVQLEEVYVEKPFWYTCK